MPSKPDQSRAAVRVFSGIQPSGNLHLGNYLGAIKRWVEGQDDSENFICVVDLHAITTYQDPQELLEQTRELAAHLLAAGIDPLKTTLFIQSQVRAHAEGSWLLSCVTPLGWLQRMTQFKDKSSKLNKQDSISTGLMTYPVLQAADILLYDADEVPVGEDQKQHVELARDIAQRFNHLYGETFVVPEPRIAAVGARIMAFDDPTSKMSKSATALGHGVRMTDSDDRIRRTIKRAVTDSGREIDFSDDPAKAGVKNLLTIFQSLTGKSQQACVEHFATARGYGDLKQEVAELVVATVGPHRERFLELMSDPSELDRLLSIGAERAAAISEPKVLEVKEKLGFILPS